MKKIIFLIAISCSLLCEAQQPNPIALSNPNSWVNGSATVTYAVDTITNAASEGPYFKALGAQRNKVTITMIVTKISGTVAGGMVLQGSNNPTYDATTFAPIKTFGIDSTVTATNATNAYNFCDNTGSFLWYRVLWTGSGTMSASYRASAYKSQ